MDVLASVGAEWLKLRKRPAVWALGIALVALMMTLQYGFPLLAFASMPRGTELAAGVTPESLKQVMYPSHFVQTTLGGLIGGLGSAIALILGVLVCGSEYSWSTLKTVFTQRPGRLATFMGKVIALALVLAIYDVVVFAATAVCSTVLGAFLHASPEWPATVDVAKALLTAWLLMGMWAELGMLFAVLLRQSGLAIGLGLVYAIAVEGIILGTLRPLSWMGDIERAFPGANATALVQSFGSAVHSAVATTPLVEARQAVFVLLAYLLAFCLLSAVLLRSRDVA